MRISELIGQLITKLVKDGDLLVEVESHDGTEYSIRTIEVRPRSYADPVLRIVPDQY